MGGGMSEIASIMTAAAALLVPVGTGIGWLANRTDKRFKAVESKLVKCEEREAASSKITAKQLIVIELLWQVASKSKTAAPVLARCKEHLDELTAKVKGDDKHD